MLYLVLLAHPKCFSYTEGWRWILQGKSHSEMQFISYQHLHLNYINDMTSVQIIIMKYQDPMKPPDIPSNLTYIKGNGMPCTIDACVAIGSGSPFAKMFMKRVWHLGYPWSKWQS